MTLTDEQDTVARSYTREELVWSIRQNVLDLIPIMVGSGPFDLDASVTPPCAICDLPLNDYTDLSGNVSALGLGVYARSRWIVFHTKCVRKVEDGERFMCPLPPCPVPVTSSGANIYQTVTDYLDHIEAAHFIARNNAPSPVMK